MNRQRKYALSFNVYFVDVLTILKDESKVLQIMLCLLLPILK